MDTSKPSELKNPTFPILVSIALPYYESRPNQISGARISVADRQSDTQLMEDIDAIARASLDARMPAITARAIARAIAKGVIQESVDTAGKQRNDDAVQFFGSMLIRILSVATERADTRSWLTLPPTSSWRGLRCRRAATPSRWICWGERTSDRDTGISGVVISKDRKTYLTQHSMP